MKYYQNSGCTDVLEFHDDMKRIKYIKRLFKKYKDTGELKERLILNHLIVLYNVFHHPAMTKMLMHRLKGYEDFLKTFLIYLSYWPPERGVEISIDQRIVDVLRRL